MSGPERLARVTAMIRQIRVDVVYKADPAYVLDVYALAQDSYWPLQYVPNINSECALSAQARWVSRQYTRTLDQDDHPVFVPTKRSSSDEVPRLDERESLWGCLSQPVFRKCFPGLFDPDPGWTGCWAPVKPTGKPQ